MKYMGETCSAKYHAVLDRVMGGSLPGKAQSSGTHVQRPPHAQRCHVKIASSITWMLGTVLLCSAACQL